VLENSRQTLGPEHPATLRAMRNLAFTHCDLGKIEEAVQFFLVVLEVTTPLLGHMHSDMISSQHDLLHRQNMDPHPPRSV
jgi:hypothetical protein